jgi:hypothetical protein
LFNSRPVDQRQFHFYTIDREQGIRSVQWISENRVALGLVEEGIEIWEIDESATSATLVKGLKHESVTVRFIYLLTSCHCTFSTIYFPLFHLGRDSRNGMGRTDEMFGRLYIRRMDDGKLSLLFIGMGVSS